MFVLSLKLVAVLASILVPLIPKKAKRKGMQNLKIDRSVADFSIDQVVVDPRKLHE